MRFAYADPPYIGQARKHYGMPEVDHGLLIERLSREYPDGWALSASSPSLHLLLPLCPDDVRVAAWVKPFASFKRGVNPAYAWEPVIWRGGRTWRERGGKHTCTVRDWVSANITLRKGLSGAKPEAFCRWILALLGFRDGDQLDDLFPGTGVMGAAASQFQKPLGRESGGEREALRAGAEAMADMVADLYPGYDRQALDAIWRAMQDKYGSAGRQLDIAEQRARAMLAAAAKENQ